MKSSLTCSLVLPPMSKEMRIYPKDFEITNSLVQKHPCMSKKVLLSELAGNQPFIYERRHETTQPALWEKWRVSFVFPLITAPGAWTYF